MKTGLPKPSRRHRRLIEDPSAEPGTRPSVQGYRFLLLILLLGLAAVNTGNNLIYLILSMIGAMVIVSMVMVREGLKGLTVEARAPHPVFAGADTAVSLSMSRAEGLRPGFDLRFRMEAPGTADRPAARIARLARIDGGGRAASRLNIRPARRGRFTLDHLLASTGFPFGLIIKTVRVPVGESFLVYPCLVESGKIAPWITGLSAGLPTIRRGQGEDYLFDRRYRDGDGIRHIHWKASARTGRLMVKEYAEEEPVRMAVILETGRHTFPEGFEKAVSVAASLCNHFGREGLLVRLVAGSTDTGFGTGPHHLELMLDTLALVEHNEAYSSPPVEPGAFRLRVTADPSRQGVPGDPADLVIDASVIL